MLGLQTLKKPEYQKAKMAALGVLADFGITEPPVDPVLIARQLGVSVHFVAFDRSAEDVSGFYDADENAIYVNKDELPLRQTFTVAHELGHKILHEEWAKSSNYKVLMRDANGAEDPIEKEANVFAANLLVPRKFLDAYHNALPASALSKLFAVSIPVIKNRLNFEYGA